MRRLRVLAIILPLVVTPAAIFIIPGRGQQQRPQKNTPSGHFDENRFSIADYAAPEPSDPFERSKRQARGKKYDKSTWNIYPDAQWNVSRTHAINFNLPALPVTESTAVIVGQVTDAKAYLSNDKTGVYSVFLVQVHEVLKNSSKLSLSTSASVEVERDGGRVRFPNGRTLLYIATDMPQVGRRYVLFLTNPLGQSDFQILSGYELRDGKVYRLDDLPNFYRYENADEVTLLSELRSRVAKP